jgi:hypothetical protein
MGHIEGMKYRIVGDLVGVRTLDAFTASHFRILTRNIGLYVPCDQASHPTSDEQPQIKDRYLLKKGKWSCLAPLSCASVHHVVNSINIRSTKCLGFNHIPEKGA